MATKLWTSPWLPGARIDPAIAILEAAGYQRGWGSVCAGGYLCDEEPMYHDGTYLKSLVVAEDPSRPVVDHLQAILDPDPRARR